MEVSKDQKGFCQSRCRISHTQHVGYGDLQRRRISMTHLRRTASGYHKNVYFLATWISDQESEEYEHNIEDSIGCISNVQQTSAPNLCHG